MKNTLFWEKERKSLSKSTQFILALFPIITQFLKTMVKSTDAAFAKSKLAQFITKLN